MSMHQNFVALNLLKKISNNGRWKFFVVQMKQLLKNFLLSRSDRKKFIYFRLTGEDRAEQYILAYGMSPNMEEANRQFAQLNLVLPQSVQPKAQQLSKYADFVNDLGSDELKNSDKSAL